MELPSALLGEKLKSTNQQCCRFSYAKDIENFIKHKPLISEECMYSSLYSTTLMYYMNLYITIYVHAHYLVIKYYI